MPKISIIMGAYNCADTIIPCVESIMKQTYKNWEFIICDDCSEDNTYQILKKLSARDQRIIVIKNERNRRLAASLNACLKIATGEYVARMDADDECLPTRLEEQLRFLEEHEEYAVVGCNRVVFDESGDKGIRNSIEFPTRNILKRDTPYAHPTIMMRKKVYDVLGGYTVSEETMRAEDLDLWFRFYEHGYKGYNLQKVLYRYHESEKDYKKRSLRAAIETSKVYLKGYKKAKFPAYVKVYALKPIIAALIPHGLLSKYHKTKMKQD